MMQVIKLSYKFKYGLLQISLKTVTLQTLHYQIRHIQNNFT